MSRTWHISVVTFIEIIVVVVGDAAKNARKGDFLLPIVVPNGNDGCRPETGAQLEPERSQYKLSQKRRGIYCTEYVTFVNK